MGQELPKETAEPKQNVKEAKETCTIPALSLCYHDLRDLFFATVQELIDLAFNDSSSDTNSPNNKFWLLVEELEEIKRKRNFRREVFPMMFEGECWEMAYGKTWIRSEPNLKRRILDGIHGVIKIWEYILEKPDFGTGNEKVIFRRMVDPTTENPFDLNHMMPAGAGTQ